MDEGRQEPTKSRTREFSPIVVRTLTYKADGIQRIGRIRSHLFVVSLNGDALKLTSGDYQVAAPSWSVDAREIAFVASRHASRDLDGVSNVFVVSAHGGEPRQVTTFWKGTASAPIFTADRTIIFVGADSALTPRQSSLYRVSADGGLPTPLLPEFDRSVLISAPGQPGSRPSVSPTNHVIFCARDAGRVHAYSVPVHGGQATPILGGDDRIISDITLASDGSRLAYTATDALSLPEIFVSAANGTEEQRVTALNDELHADLELCAPVSRRFTASDGVTIQGWVLRADWVDRPGPLLLDIHGGPHNSWGPAFDHVHSYHQVLAAAGWTVLLVNPRGSDGYGQEFYAAASRTNHGSDRADLLAAVNALVADGLVDPDRLAVTGYSYGAFLVSSILTVTDRFAAAVVGGMVSDLNSFIGTSDIGLLFGICEFGEGDRLAASRLRDLSPLSLAHAVQTPVLIYHGMDDYRCPVGQAEQWFTALRRLGRSVQLVLYPGASHAFVFRGRPSHQVDFARRLIEWIGGSPPNASIDGKEPRPHADQTQI